VYRERRERAQQLRAEGKTAKQISREMGVEESQIKKWISRRMG
jgi:transposase-like protein